jgi:hypothetical protein
MCMKARLLAAVAAALVVVSGLSPAEGAAAPSRALFGAPPAAAGARAALAPAGRAVVRQRAVSARLDLLIHADGSPALGAGERVDLNLFEDVSVSMRVREVTRHGPRGHAWRGTVEGDDLASATLVVYDGALVGQVVTPHAVYSIGYAPDGTQVVQVTDPSALPSEAPPRTVSARGADAIKLGGESVEASGDEAGQIDVMVGFTAAARAAAGGTAAMQAAVNLAVASANQAYANNGLTQRLRLVYAGEVAIPQGGIFDELDALSVDPLVRWLRDVTRADVVSLIVDHGQGAQACGLGFLLGANSTAFEPFAFSVVERVCASANLSFAHELGHNMGAHHDLFVSGGEPTVFPYSHGHVDLVVPFRTIMAYVDQCVQALGTGCNRLQFFSSPNQTQGGRPLGHAASADNVRTLGETALSVANFRQALTPPLVLTTAVNQPSFAVGQTLVASVTVENAVASPSTADLYLGLLLPDGSAVFFTSTVITPASGYAFGHTLDLASYRPVLAGLSLAAPFTMTLQPFFAYQRQDADPAGGLALFALLTTAGALADGVLAPDELLASSLSPFTFPGVATTGGGGPGQ